MGFDAWPNVAATSLALALSGWLAIRQGRSVAETVLPEVGCGNRRDATESLWKRASITTDKRLATHLSAGSRDQSLTARCLNQDSSKKPPHRSQVMLHLLRFDSLIRDLPTGFTV